LGKKVTGDSLSVIGAVANGSSLSLAVSFQRSAVSKMLIGRSGLIAER
jgi:hypothetical protein